MKFYWVGGSFHCRYSTDTFYPRTPANKCLSPARQSWPTTRSTHLVRLPACADRHSTTWHIRPFASLTSLSRALFQTHPAAAVVCRKTTRRSRPFASPTSLDTTCPLSAPHSASALRRRFRTHRAASSASSSGTATKRLRQRSRAQLRPRFPGGGKLLFLN